MSLNITRQGFGLTVLISSLLLALFFWSRSLISSYGLSYSGGSTSLDMSMPISEYIYSHFIRLPQILRQLTIGILALLNGVLISSIMIRQMVVSERTYMPITICIIVSCGLYTDDYVIIPLLASSLLTFAFETIIRSFKRIPEYSMVFNGALYIGLSILIYPPMAIFTPLLLVAMVILQKNIREWIIVLTGVSIPILLSSYIYWGMGHDFSFTIRSIIDILSQISLRTDYASMLAQPQQIIFWSTVAAIVVLSFMKFSQNGSRTRTRPYKTYLIATWSLLFALILTLVFSSTLNATAILSLPLSIMLTYYFSGAKGWLPNLLYTLLVSSMVACNLMQLLSVIF